MSSRICKICKEPFEPRKGFETSCYGCYHANRISELREENSKHLFQLAYLQDEINKLYSENQRLEDVLHHQSNSNKIPDELLDREILLDALFLCHPDRNGNDERSRKVSVWLNGLREQTLEKINEN